MLHKSLDQVGKEAPTISLICDEKYRSSIIPFDATNTAI
jgi:hypothetical protein